MSKSCNTCCFRSFPIQTEPCNSCKRGSGLDDKYMPRLCHKCMHFEEPIHKEPCRSCCHDAQKPGFEPITREEPAMEPAKDDKVNHPSHYTTGEIEVINYIRDKLGCEEFTGYCIGNVMKYISRWRHKDGKQDLDKAKVYLQWAIESAAKELEGKKDGAGQGD